MTDTQFTPGPWEAEYGTDGYYFVTHSEGIELSSDTDANARLLSTAPELYSALEALMANDGARGTYNASKAFDAKLAAEAALAKARGQ